jgi:hypothetical protein
MSCLSEILRHYQKRLPEIFHGFDVGTGSAPKPSRPGPNSALAGQCCNQNPARMAPDGPRGSRTPAEAAMSSAARVRQLPPSCRASGPEVLKHAALASPGSSPRAPQRVCGVGPNNRKRPPRGSPYLYARKSPHVFCSPQGARPRSNVPPPPTSDRGHFFATDCGSSVGPPGRHRPTTPSPLRSLPC